MTRVDLLVTNAGELATLAAPDGWKGGGGRRGAARGLLGLLRDGAAAISGGRVVACGSSRELSSSYDADRTLDARGLLVTPGLVDAHAHLVWAGTREFELPWKLAGRTYAQIAAAGGGIAFTAAATRKASEAELASSGLARARIALAHGTTTLEAKSGYALETEGELRILRATRRIARETPQAVVPTFLGAHLVPAERRGRREEYVRQVVEEQLPAVAREGLARFCDVFLDAGAFTPEDSERILEAARSEGLGLRLHADEFADDGAAALAVRLGAASADHLLAVGDGGIEALASSGGRTVATLAPLVPFALMQHRYAPARRLLDAGAAVALGTDFNPNVPCLSMQEVLWHAVYGMLMMPEEALVAATVNGAHSLGLVDAKGVPTHGALVPGARADLVVWDVASVAGLFYEFGRNHVAHIVCGGREQPLTPADPRPA